MFFFVTQMCQKTKYLQKLAAKKTIWVNPYQTFSHEKNLEKAAEGLPRYILCCGD